MELTIGESKNTDDEEEEDDAQQSIPCVALAECVISVNKRQTFIKWV